MATGDTFVEQVQNYVLQHPGCDRQQMELDLQIHKSGIAFAIQTLVQDELVCHVKDPDCHRGMHYFYYPGKTPPETAATPRVSEVYMHLSGNPWLTVKEIAGDLAMLPQDAYREVYALLKLGVIAQRRREGVKGMPCEYEVKPNTKPPAQSEVAEVERVGKTLNQFPVKTASPVKSVKTFQKPIAEVIHEGNPAVRASKATESTADNCPKSGSPNESGILPPLQAGPRVNVVHGIHAELATPRGKIILILPHLTPKPDLEKAIKFLGALLA